MTALTGASLEVVRDGQVLKVIISRSECALGHMIRKNNSKSTFSWLQSLGGYTWPGIEYGEPPSYKHSFFEVSSYTPYFHLESCLRVLLGIDQ